MFVSKKKYEDLKKDYEKMTAERDAWRRRNAADIDDYNKLVYQFNDLRRRHLDLKSEKLS